MVRGSANYQLPDLRSRATKPRTTNQSFDDEWILRAIEGHSSFFTKRMFGGLAVYLFGRQMLVLVQPTKTGRWSWHGVLICTEQRHHAAIIETFPRLAPHDVLKKWLYIDSHDAQFETTMEGVVQVIARNDQRIGIQPRARRAVPVNRRP